MALGETYCFYANLSGTIRANLFFKERKQVRQLVSVSVYLVPMADHLTVNISGGVDSYSDGASGRTLHLQLYQTEN